MCGLGAFYIPGLPRRVAHFLATTCAKPRSDSMRSRFTAAVLMSVTLAAWQDRADDVPADAGNTCGGVRWLTSAQMQTDFDLMRHALEEAHPGLYRYSTKGQMDREFDVQRGKLSRPMTKEQFEVVVAQTLVSIRCGHTRMHWDREME